MAEVEILAVQEEPLVEPADVLESGTSIQRRGRGEGLDLSRARWNSIDMISESKSLCQASDRTNVSQVAKAKETPPEVDRADRTTCAALGSAVNGRENDPLHTSDCISTEEVGGSDNSLDLEPDIGIQDENVGRMTEGAAAILACSETRVLRRGDTRRSQFPRKLS